MRHSSPTAVIVFAILTAGCDGERPDPTGTSAFSHAPGLGTPPAARNFVAPLDPRQEVPTPTLTETKNPTGNAVLRLAGDGTELDYRLIAANIENVTQAHIHCGQRGIAGPIVAFLFGFVAEGVSPNGILAEGTVSAGDVMPVADSGACPGGVADFAGLVSQMRAGNTYVNVHTIQNAPGEIRGQIRSAGPGH